jgi:hypothetical protein
MSAMPFHLYDTPETVAKRRADYAILLRQAELRLRAATMRTYAARLEQDAGWLDAMLDEDPSSIPALDLAAAKRDVRKYALECERLRKELGL